MRKAGILLNLTRQVVVQNQVVTILTAGSDITRHQDRLQEQNTLFGNISDID
jgi:hypothetical protein